MLLTSGTRRFFAVAKLSDRKERLSMYVCVYVCMSVRVTGTIIYPEKEGVFNKVSRHVMYLRLFFATDVKNFPYSNLFEICDVKTAVRIRNKPDTF